MSYISQCLLFLIMLNPALSWAITYTSTATSPSTMATPFIYQFDEHRFRPHNVIDRHPLYDQAEGKQMYYKVNQELFPRGMIIPFNMLRPLYTYPYQSYTACLIQAHSPRGEGKIKVEHNDLFTIQAVEVSKYQPHFTEISRSAYREFQYIVPTYYRYHFELIHPDISIHDEDARINIYCSSPTEETVEQILKQASLSESPSLGIIEQIELDLDMTPVALPASE